MLVYIPLGAVVEDCVQVNDRFVKCIYKGQTGYILIDYLGAYEPPQNNSFDDLTLPAYDCELCKKVTLNAITASETS